MASSSGCGAMTKTFICLLSVAYSLVDLEIFHCHFAGRKSALRALPDLCSVQLQTFGNCLEKLGFIGCQMAGQAWFDDFGYRAQIHGCNRRSAEHGFGQDQSEGFGILNW